MDLHGSHGLVTHTTLDGVASCLEGNTDLDQSANVYLDPAAILSRHTKTRNAVIAEIFKSPNNLKTR